MNKLLKIFLAMLLIIVFAYIPYTIYATEGEATETEASEEASSEEVIEETPTTGLSALTSDTVTSVTSVNSYSQANLELNNILCFLLIAIGVIIILLAIAILIRLKR